MNEWEKLHEAANRYKKMYPEGTRIELLSMSNDPRPVASGTRGTVTLVDDIGQLQVVFDDGRLLGVVPGEDSFRVLTQSEIMAEQEEKEEYVDFGDGCKIKLPEEPVNCSRLGYFDELEEECWRLVKQYCATFGIELMPQEDGEVLISFDIAKGIQDYILEQFEEAGVRFNFETQETDEAEDPAQSM